MGARPGWRTPAALSLVLCGVWSCAGRSPAKSPVGWSEEPRAGELVDSISRAHDLGGEAGPAHHELWPGRPPRSDTDTRSGAADSRRQNRIHRQPLGCRHNSASAAHCRKRVTPEHSAPLRLGRDPWMAHGVSSTAGRERDVQPQFSGGRRPQCCHRSRYSWNPLDIRSDGRHRP